MHNALEDILRSVTEETFESLAFMFAMPGDEEAEPADMIAAGVSFTGPFSGMVYLAVERTVLDELAGNMLGVMDPGDLTEAQQTDGFGELLNVVCGNLLPRLAGEEALFDVGAPVVLEDTTMPEMIRNRNRIGAVELELDTGAAAVALYADAETAETIANAG